MTELFDCIYHGDVQRCRELLDNGADPNILDESGQPILSSSIDMIHVGCSQKSNSERCNLCIKIGKCSELLIKYQANVNIQYGDGWTALHNAVCTKQISYVKMLLDNGADYNIPNKKGKTAKDYAIQMNNQDIINLIESYEIPISLCVSKEPECY